MNKDSTGAVDHAGHVVAAFTAVKRAVIGILAGLVEFILPRREYSPHSRKAWVEMKGAILRDTDLRYTSTAFRYPMKAYKYKLKPSAKIIASFESWLAILCELYSAALQERRDAYKINHLSIDYPAQAKQLPEIKAERPDLARIHSQVVQNALKRVAFAFDNFFRRVKEGLKPGFPRFRSRSRYDSFTYPQSGFSLKSNKLHLSKIGKVKIHFSRPIEGEIKTCTIKREADGWYAIFTVEESKKEVAPAPKVRYRVDCQAADP